MSKLARAITVALGTVVFSASAQAATFVVTANSNAFDAQLARKVEAAGGTITARLPQIGVAIVKSDYSDFGARASKIPGVRSAVQDLTVQFDVPESEVNVEADYANPPNSGDNDPFFDLQWGHAAIDAAGAWNQGYRGAGVKVAVLDTGVFCQHVDIAPNLLAADSTSFVPGESYCNTVASQNSHGTHTSGTILAADNGIGTIGVAPQAKLIAVKVLSAATGGGSFEGIIQGIVYAADKGADVINMSLGVRGGLQVNGKGANQVSELVNATKRAVQYARSQNALVVVSAGNDGRDLDHDSGTKICDSDGTCFVANLKAFPAELPGVLAVSALGPMAWAYDLNTNLDRLASYSNYGQSAISFGAPGGDFAYEGNENCTVKGVTIPCWAFDMVLSTTRSPGSYSWNAGTSMAAPHVSGVAALIIGKHGGEMAPAEVERILRASADDLGKPGNDSTFGNGRVNAARAVQY
ncbi:S8 family serine peptidase [Lysobacter niastensis]|uniref:S8 family serine peptidase n=1 Tax=Lysobacter niastensis TaxID=380629 RepID=A0ABS0B5L3_9GAMM|nr:S8 family serine peptidase [Lysobacter niastensis]MBF6024170.1 S8 family serine peptidase [Lysobacter niastensis]